MHIDLTLEEMRYILETVGAGDSTKPVVKSIISKMDTACRNFNPSLADAELDPARAAAKWKAPI